MLMRLVFAWKLAFFQDSCQPFFGLGWLTWYQCFLKMHIVGEGPGATLSFKTSPFYHKQLASSYITSSQRLAGGHSFCSLLMSMSEAFSISFTLCTLIKLYYTKALSDQALSLGPNWNLLVWRPRILVSLVAQQQPFTIFTVCLEYAM